MAPVSLVVWRENSIVGDSGGGEERQIVQFVYAAGGRGFLMVRV